MELNNPFLEHLGVEMTHWREGQVELTLPPSPAHGNRTGVVQGGVIATLLDAACGYAGLYAPNGHEEEQAATISLSINYMAPAPVSEPLHVYGRVKGKGRSVFFSEAEVRTPGNVLVASAQGAFKRRRIVSK